MNGADAGSGCREPSARVRDDPRRPDPGFAELYAALPEAAELEPWLTWCRAAEPPVLYLGIGTGRLAAPLAASGVDLVGVDAHPGMLRHLRQRLPEVRSHLALIEDLRLPERFDLVIGPSGVLTAEACLATAAWHLGPGGKVGMEFINPHWLRSGQAEGVRFTRRPDGSNLAEIDYVLPGGRVVVQEVEASAPEDLGPPPEEIEDRLGRSGLELLWMGGAAGLGPADSPTYFAMAGRSRRRGGHGRPGRSQAFSPAG